MRIRAVHCHELAARRWNCVTLPRASVIVLGQFRESLDRAFRQMRDLDLRPILSKEQHRVFDALERDAIVHDERAKAVSRGLQQKLVVDARPRD